MALVMEYRLAHYAKLETAAILSGIRSKGVYSATHVKALEKELDAAEVIINRYYGDRYKDMVRNHTEAASRPLMSPKRSMGSVMPELFRTIAVPKLEELVANREW